MMFGLLSARSVVVRESIESRESRESFEGHEPGTTHSALVYNEWAMTAKPATVSALSTTCA